MARLSVLGALAAALVLAGCGGSEEDRRGSTTPSRLAPQPLAPVETAEVNRLHETINAYCVGVARFLAGERAAPTRAELDRAIEAVDKFAALAREKPSATLPSGADLRLALGDLAEGLEGSNCSTELVRRIDEALATIQTSP
jgi:hypothetical protein